MRWKPSTPEKEKKVMNTLPPEEKTICECGKEIWKYWFDPTTGYYKQGVLYPEMKKCAPCHFK